MNKPRFTIATAEVGQTPMMPDSVILIMVVASHGLTATQRYLTYTTHGGLTHISNEEAAKMALLKLEMQVP